MYVEKFTAQKNERVSKLILDKFSFLGYDLVKKALRNRDVKINGKRTGEDIKANVGDEIEIYHQRPASLKLDIVFEDDNLIVINKPRMLESVSESGDSAERLVKDYLGESVFPVHRLDRNTAGLLVFAKNIESKNSLDRAFKERSLEKYYLALVLGCLEGDKTLTGYLKKDREKSFVEIVDFPQKGFNFIETRYKIIKKLENLSLIEVELVTGKTHQIRAHFAHIGHPILGDEKYGDSKTNKIYKLKFQCLTSYKLIFHFKKDDYLAYLDGQKIELCQDKIDFLSKI